MKADLRAILDRNKPAPPVFDGALPDSLTHAFGSPQIITDRRLIFSPTTRYDKKEKCWIHGVVQFVQGRIVGV